MQKGKAAYILFRDQETGIPIVYKADKAIALANIGNLGVYNTVNEFGSVSVDTSKRNAVGVDKHSLRMALRAENFDAYLDTAWLNTGKPMLSAVCVLYDKSAKMDYVWCKVFVTAKYAQNAYNFFTAMTDVISDKYAEKPMITQMDKFAATVDENYVYCGCIMIALETLEWLMTTDAREMFAKRGSAMYSSFVVNTAHINEFDYKATHRSSEKPNLQAISELEDCAKKNNARIVREIQALKTKTKE